VVHALTIFLFFVTLKLLHVPHLLVYNILSCFLKEEAGEHIVFQCPSHREEREKLGALESWESLDRPVWRGEGKDRYDAVEDFFLYCHHFLNRGTDAVPKLFFCDFTTSYCWKSLL